MSTQHPDWGRILDRRKFLKGAAALAALGAAAAGTRARAEEDGGGNGSNRLGKLIRDWIDLANRIIDFIEEHEGSFTAERQQEIRNAILDFLELLVDVVIKFVREAGPPFRVDPEDLEEALDEARAAIRDLFDLIRRALQEGDGGGTGGGIG